MRYLAKTLVITAATLCTGHAAAQTKLTETLTFEATTTTLEDQPDSLSPDRDPASTAVLHSATLDLALVFGFGNTPVVGPGDPYNGDGFVWAPRLTGEWNLSRRLLLGLVVPWSTASVDVANTGETQASQAFGNPLVKAQYTFGKLNSLAFPVVVSVGLPVAEGNADPTTAQDTAAKAKAEVNSLADSSNGWLWPEIYTPGRLPVTATVGVSWSRGRWEAAAWTKLAILFNTGTDLANPDSIFGNYDLHGVALRGATQARGRWKFFGDAFFGCAANLAYTWVSPIEFKSSSGADNPSSVQFSVQPEAGTALRMSGWELHPYIGGLLPVAGPLGGHLGSFFLGARAFL